MGIKWNDLSLAQRSLIEGMPTEPSQPRAQILRRPRLERDEQRIFANWCLLHALPFCWHATHKRSSATVGVFDFWVGRFGRGCWIEFKSACGRLSSEQEAFKDKLERERIPYAIVRSADEAIKFILALCG